MSTEYTARCNTCMIVCSGQSFNHSQKIVDWIIANAETIKGLKESEPSKDIEIGYRCDYEGVMEFILKHAGHDLEIVDEYWNVRRNGEWIKDGRENLYKRSSEVEERD